MTIQQGSRPTMTAHRLFAMLMAALLTTATSPALAHFLELIPSATHVSEGGSRQISLDLIFTHPMNRGPVMDLAKPERTGVRTNGKTRNLTDLLKPAPHNGQRAWRMDYAVKAPGTFVFFAEPQPYWEPAEGKMILHYPKVVVDAFGWSDGWDDLVGLPVEIAPLVRPYGLWTGNIFRGTVLKDGAPVPFAEIEVEWVNDGSIQPPSEAFETQVIKADSNGVFAYAMPRAGWWGFAALVEADQPMKSPQGEDVPVELGGLMWVRTVDMK
jgi:nickel transport protein